MLACRTERPVESAWFELASFTKETASSKRAIGAGGQQNSLQRLARDRTKLLRSLACTFGSRGGLLYTGEAGNGLSSECLSARAQLPSDGPEHAREHRPDVTQTAADVQPTTARRRGSQGASVPIPFGRRLNHALLEMSPSRG